MMIHTVRNAVFSLFIPLLFAVAGPACGHAQFPAGEEPVCVEAEPSFFESIFGAVFDAGKFVLIDIPVATVTVAADVVVATPGLLVNTAVGTVKFVHTGGYICFWWTGLIPMPDDEAITRRMMSRPPGEQ